MPREAAVGDGEGIDRLSEHLGRHYLTVRDVPGLAELASEILALTADGQLQLCTCQ
jgi:hypothetical protein